MGDSGVNLPTSATRYRPLFSSIAAIGVIAASASLAACAGEPPAAEEAVAEDNITSAALAEVVERAADGHGLAYFTLPDSSDLSKIPQDPKNPLTPEKVALGKLLFHESGLLSTPKHEEGAGTASCASCHHAAAGFQAGVRQGIGEGGMGFGERGEGRVANPAYSEADLDVQPIRSPSAMHSAFLPVALWDGAFGGAPNGPNAGTEGAWAAGTPKQTNELGFQGAETQAIAGLEAHRLAPLDRCAPEVLDTYRPLLERAFAGEPAPPEPYGLRVWAGLAIAAYERTILATEAPWQRWLRGDKRAMTQQQKRGAALFFGKAACASCHTGPALGSSEFFALGMPDLPEGAPDVHGTVNDKPVVRGRGGFTGEPADDYKFKVPQLYNLADSPFYGHGGTFESIRSVVEYKNAATPAASHVPASQLTREFVPLGLTDKEIDDLTAFLTTALRDPNLARYAPTELPTGLCFPVADPKAKRDLGCNLDEIVP